MTKQEAAAIMHDVHNGDKDKHSTAKIVKAIQVLAGDGLKPPVQE